MTMKIPADLLYTKQHEWIAIDGDTATVGITDYAQQELGDIVYVELPEVGRSFEAEDSFGSVESVKAVSNIYMPMSGKVIEVNEDLADAPEIVNQDPYGEGWLIKIQLTDPSQADELMSAEEYEQYLEEETG
ncbi:MAG: glycine cleavage system protein GcvH [Acidobacteriota bacterium]